MLVMARCRSDFAGDGASIRAIRVYGNSAELGPRFRRFLRPDSRSCAAPRLVGRQLRGLEKDNDVRRRSDAHGGGGTPGVANIYGVSGVCLDPRLLGHIGVWRGRANARTRY